MLERVMGWPSGDEPKADPIVPALASEDSGASAEAAAEPRESVIQALRHHVAEASKGRLHAAEIQEHGQLFDRGYLDSFSYVEYLAFIEQKYRVRIDDSQLAGHLSTIAAMAEHILQAQAPRPE